MKRIIFACFLIIGLSSGLAFAQDTQTAEKLFHELHPQFNFNSFKESEIPGLYEVTTGGQIFYFSPKDYLVFGEIIDKSGKNITAEKRQAMVASKVKDLPLDKAMKIGSGKNVVIEISDPDCPFCRKASEFFTKRTDVTRYVFFGPLPMHPDAKKHAEYILAKNTLAAYEEAYTGKLDGTDVALSAEKEEAAAELLKEHEAVVAKLGLRGVPAFIVNGKFVNGANIPMIEKLLDK